MKFTKMHGAGNDFIIIDNRDGAVPAGDLPELARRLCRPHLSLGGDGLMVVVSARGCGDYGMLFYNCDGSLGEMCGNGARCICRYGYEHGLAGETPRVETTAGLVVGRRIDRSRWQVRLNDPTVIDLHRPVPVGKTVYDCAYVELGDPGLPHAVVLLPDWNAWPEEELRALGRALRTAEAFPKGANVSFVRLLRDDAVKAVTFERGVEDFTLACGTGCGAIAVTLKLSGLAGDGPIAVSMPGGDLTVALTAAEGGARDLLLTGPTCTVCEGELIDAP